MYDAQHTNAQIGCRPDTTGQHTAVIFIFATDMCSAHHPRPVASFQNLHLANSAAALPATDGDPAFEADFSRAENRLIMGTRKCISPLAVVTIYNVNLKSHQRVTPPAGSLTLLLKSPSSIGAQIPSRKPYQPFNVNSSRGTNLKVFFCETHGVL